MANEIAGFGDLNLFIFVISSDLILFSILSKTGLCVASRFFFQANGIVGFGVLSLFS